MAHFRLAQCRGAEEEEEEEEEGSSFVFSGDGNINQVRRTIGEDTLSGYQDRGWRAGHLHV